MFKHYVHYILSFSDKIHLLTMVSKTPLSLIKEKTINELKRSIGKAVVTIHNHTLTLAVETVASEYIETSSLI